MILRSFARGRIGLPAEGMAALPPAVAAPLPADLIDLRHPGRRGRARPGPHPGRRDPLPRRRGRRRPARGGHAAAHPGDGYACTATPPTTTARRSRRSTSRSCSSTATGGRSSPTRWWSAGPRRRTRPPGRHLVATSVVGPTAPPEPTIRAELDPAVRPLHSRLDAPAPPWPCRTRCPPRRRRRGGCASRWTWATGCSWPVTTGTARPSRARWPAAGVTAGAVLAANCRAVELILMCPRICHRFERRGVRRDC